MGFANLEAIMAGRSVNDVIAEKEAERAVLEGRMREAVSLPEQERRRHHLAALDRELEELRRKCDGR